MRAKHTRETITKLITADPGLPRSQPTQSYWQNPPHALSAVRSTSLPEYTDIAIIGSGITSASVSKTLLRCDSKVQVVVLEARTLCSGATGRNGGQLATNASESYGSLKHQYGAQEAGKIVKFTLDTLAHMRELAREYGEAECEFQSTEKIRVFLDEDLFHEAKESLSELERDHPQFRAIFAVLEKERLTEYGVHQGVGAIMHPAGTIWPYRLVTKVFEDLLKAHHQRYSIETETPVTSIFVDEAVSSHKYRLLTPRGALYAKRVIHCTNGYAGHLLPGLRGRVFPVCGSMTVQDLHSSNAPETESPPANGHRYSWAVHYSPHRNPLTNTIRDGLYYLAQSAKTKLYFFGGDDADWKDSLSGDDTQTIPSSVATLQHALSDLLSFDGGYECQSDDQKRNQVVASWTGVMRFSSDGVPIVGKLPASVTGRADTTDGEWAAVAFNGYGMANCWLAGHALGLMVLGQNDKNVWGSLPRAYLISATRLEKSLSVERSARGLEQLEGPSPTGDVESKL